ncbi:MAG: hypothetical protein HUJ90_01615 [Bacteroidales bacterium]|nr:hypothetical protein [Bacteroidales bacterium]
MSAQNADNSAAKTNKAKRTKTTYVAKGSDNWFVSLNGGIQVYHGDHDNMAKFGQRVTPSFDITAGKWFIPAVGIRFGFNGFNAKGATAEGIHSDGSALNGKPEAPFWLKKQAFPYFNAHVDLAVDLINMFRYKPNRVFGLNGFIGPGVAYTWDNPTAASFSINGGLMALVAVAKSVDINLGVHGMLVSDAFDGEKGGQTKFRQTFDGVGAVTIGLTWHITHKGWDAVIKER